MSFIEQILGVKTKSRVSRPSASRQYRNPLGEPKKKKALNSFMVYRGYVTPIIKTLIQHVMPSRDLARLIGASWKSLGHQAKIPFQHKAAQLEFDAAFLEDCGRYSKKVQMAMEKVMLLDQQVEDLLGNHPVNLAHLGNQVDLGHLEHLDHLENSGEDSKSDAFEKCLAAVYPVVLENLLASIDMHAYRLEQQTLPSHQKSTPPLSLTIQTLCVDDIHTGWTPTTAYIKTQYPLFFDTLDTQHL